MRARFGVFAAGLIASLLLLTEGAADTSAAGARVGPLIGAIVVPRARGVAVVDPLTAEANTLFGGGSAATGTTTGVAWSPGLRRLAVSVQQRQAGERFSGAH